MLTEFATVRSWTQGNMKMREMQFNWDTMPATDFAEEVNKRLNPLIQLLTSVDNNKRRDAVTRILVMADRAVLALIIDRLIDQLNQRCEATQRCAAESLVEMGEVTLPSLRCALTSARSSTVKAHVAAILGRMGRTATPRRQMEIDVALEVALAKATDPKVVAAILAAMDQLHPGSAEMQMTLRSLASR